MLTLDFDEISMEVELEQKTSRKKTKPFFAGPVPLDWLHRACSIQGKALHCALALLHQSKLTGTKCIKVQPALMRRFGVQRKARYSAINALQKAGLIRIEKKPSSAAVTVTLLDVVQQNAEESSNAKI